MKKIIVSIFFFMMISSVFSQSNDIWKNAMISYTKGVAPAWVPTLKANEVVIDTSTGYWYEWIWATSTTGNWVHSGYRIQTISGCAAPAYVPGKYQSVLVINGCDSLYYYRSGWRHINKGGGGANYTAGYGIDIAGTVISADTTEIATPSDVAVVQADVNAHEASDYDMDDTNEIQTLSTGTNTLTLSGGGGTVTVDTDPTNELTSLNGQTGQTQTFATGTSGTNFAISSTGNVHTFNLPTASATVTGKLSASNWTTFNAKVGGSGTSSYLPKFTAGSTIGNSIVYESGNKIGIGTSTPTEMPNWNGGMTLNIYDPNLFPNLFLSQPNNYAGLGLDNSRAYFITKKSINYYYNYAGAGSVDYMKFINVASGSDVQVGIFDYNNRIAFGKNCAIDNNSDLVIQGSTANGYYALTVKNSAGSNVLNTVNDGRIESGIGAYSVRSGEKTSASGKFASAGDAQAIELVWRRAVTGKLAAELMLDGSGLRASIESNCVINGQVQMVAIVTVVGNGVDISVGDVISMQVPITVKKIGTTTTSITPSSTYNYTASDPSMVGGNLSAYADDASDALIVAFAPPTNGGTTTQYRVVATFRGTQIKY